MAPQQIEELAKTLATLIRTDREVRKAVMDVACACPNLVVQY
jgi:hypothetical protein